MSGDPSAADVQSVTAFSASSDRDERVTIRCHCGERVGQVRHTAHGPLLVTWYPLLPSAAELMSKNVPEILESDGRVPDKVSPWPTLLSSEPPPWGGNPTLADVWCRRHRWVPVDRKRLIAAYDEARITHTKTKVKITHS